VADWKGVGNFKMSCQHKNVVLWKVVLIQCPLSRYRWKDRRAGLRRQLMTYAGKHKFLWPQNPDTQEVPSSEFLCRLKSPPSNRWQIVTSLCHRGRGNHGSSWIVLWTLFLTNVIVCYIVHWQLICWYEYAIRLIKNAFSSCTRY